MEWTMQQVRWIPVVVVAAMAMGLAGCTGDATKASVTTSPARSVEEPKKTTTTTTATTAPDGNVFCSAWADYQLSWGTGNTQTLDEHFAMARTLPPLAPQPISREVNSIITSILPSPGVDNDDDSGTGLSGTQTDILNVLRWMKANCSTPSLHGWQLDPILAALEARFGQG